MGRGQKVPLRPCTWQCALGGCSSRRLRGKRVLVRCQPPGCGGAISSLVPSTRGCYWLWVWELARRRTEGCGFVEFGTFCFLKACRLSRMRNLVGVFASLGHSARRSRQIRASCCSSACVNKTRGGLRAAAPCKKSKVGITAFVCCFCFVIKK